MASLLDLTQQGDVGTISDESKLRSMSSFFIGEERVTTQFSGLVMAYEDQQEEAFLTTSRSTRPVTPSTSTASTSRSSGWT